MSPSLQKVIIILKAYLLTAFEETVLVDKKHQISSNILVLSTQRVLIFISILTHKVLSYILYSEIRILSLFLDLIRHFKKLVCFRHQPLGLLDLKKKPKDASEVGYQEKIA